MADTINYIKEYLQHKDEDLSNFFNLDLEAKGKINITINKIKEIQKQLEEQTIALNGLYATQYTSKFTPVDHPITLCYTSRDKNNYYYDYFSLEKINIDNYTDPMIIELDTKNGVVHVPIGYAYEKAAVVIATWDYKISSDNNKITAKLVAETLVSILEQKYTHSAITTNKVDAWELQQALRHINAGPFIRVFYNVPDRKTTLSLDDLYGYAKVNKNLEMIIKTAPSELLDELIQVRAHDAPPQVNSMAALLGINPTTYKLAIDKGVIREVYELRSYIKDKVKFNVKDEDWIQFILDAKKDEEDLSFFNVNYDPRYYCTTPDGADPKFAQLLGMIAYYYDRTASLRKYYSFGKLYRYVIEGVSNQGYVRVKDFLIELIDYLNMAEQEQAEPTLNSSYLKLTHDCLARNHKIFLQEHEEEIFKGRYKDFKEVTIDGKYKFIAPKNSNDMKKEGDAQNSCIYSYLKRVIDGTCKIIFLRLVDDLAHSYISIEERDNKIVQIRGAHNRRPTMEEMKVIEKYAKKVGLEYVAGQY